MPLLAVAIGIALRWRASPHALATRSGGEVAELANLTSPLVVAYGSDATATLTGGTNTTIAGRTFPGFVLTRGLKSTT
jgi:hypothetical protein